MPRIALATSEAWPQLSPDDGELVAELAAQNCQALPVVWSDPSVDWQSFDLVVIRSCWDYHLRIEEFRRWLDTLPAVIENPAAVIRWNMHKSYLFDLERKGLRVPRLTIVPRGGPQPPPASYPVIVKPAVSASAFETHSFPDGASAASAIERLSQRFDVIVQRYVPEIVTGGEWSLIYFGGAFSHAVRKLPKSGDFRVQQELGGSADRATPPARLEEAAVRALGSLDVLYARVDLVDAAEGVMLMELELIEPSLFLLSDPQATRRFAAAIRTRALRA